MALGGLRVVAGSAIGSEHLRLRRNGQDAALVWRGPEALVGLVADGCGSGGHSEVGARLGIRLALLGLRRALAAGARLLPDLLEAIRAELRVGLAPLLPCLGDTPEAGLHEHLLFTLGGFVATPELTHVFVLGDGVVACPDGFETIEADDDAPAYPGYALVDGAAGPPRLARTRPTPFLDWIAVGTDGVAPLGCDPLARRVAELRVSPNPAVLERRLRQFATPRERIDWDARRVVREAAALHDDASLVVLLRT